MRISEVKKKREQNSYFLDDSKSIPSEQFRMLRTNINFMSVDRDLKTIVITSAEKKVGKTTISFNLAASFALQNKKVLLVDSDLRKPSIHKLMNLRNDTGLTTLIINHEPDILKSIRVTYINNLYVLTSGAIPPNPAELLSLKRMNDIIDQMKKKFDIIIFDTPPITLIADAQILAGKADGTILVVRKDKDNIDSIRRAKTMLDGANANVIGVVFNRENKKSNNQKTYGIEKNHSKI